MKGYAGKFAEIDLTEEKIREVRFDDETLKNYIGGRGLAAKILWDRLGVRWENIDPLSPENILLVLTGPLTGFFPGSRVCVSGKSPQSNGMVGSTVGGEFGVELKCAGYDGIIVKGCAAYPTYLFITNLGIDIKKASHVWGKNGMETISILYKETKKELNKMFPERGEFKEPALLYVGPAGEKRSRIAAVMSKWVHAAGYGGYGGVMGSKNLKAIVVKGFDPLPGVENFSEVVTLTNYILKERYKKDEWRRWGTAYLGYEVGARQSSEPVKNWQEEWHEERSFGIDKFEHLWVKRYWGDFGCPTTCLKISCTNNCVITDGPDYENQAYLGTNLGIFKPEDNVRLVALADNLGLCGIQCGNILGFVAELYQRGILTKDELDGIEPNWGDVEAFIKLMKKIAERDGIGDLLAEGTYRTALKIRELKGFDVTKYSVVVKGIGVGAHGLRSGLDYVMNIGYALSTQGGDHGSTARLPATITEIEILSDSGVYCVFNSMGIDEDVIWNFFNAVTGWRINSEEWYNVMARRIIHIQRAMLLLGGPDIKWDPKIDDDNPKRFYDPLPSGPYRGSSLDKAIFEKDKKEYYDALGWDDKGIPTTEELKRLGLEEIDKRLESLRH
ncbi:MAG: aldehyde ferredoxin oxidoreductase C-terminal domain-containing protein [Nitrososphaeria archaeon]